MSEHEQGLLEWLVGNAKRAWLMRLAIVGALIATPIVLWSYSDRHNDARYVGKIEYVNDLKNQQALVAQTASDLASKTIELANGLKRQNELHTQDHDKLTEIGQDIKWLKEQKQREIAK
jgi:hypothetical protein